MKLNVFVIIFLLIAAFGKAQNIGIGTSNPHGSARLDVSADNKGFLPPRLTTLQRNAINLPAKGLLVFDSTKNSYWYFENSQWRELGVNGKALNGDLGEYVYDYENVTPDSILINESHTSVTNTSAVIFDTGGPFSNYGNNQRDTMYIGLFGGNPNSTVLGFRVKVNYDLAVNDTLFLHDGGLGLFGSSPGPVVKYYTNSNGTDSLLVNNESSFAITMRSNNTGTAAGFAIKYQLLLWSYNGVPENVSPEAGWHFITSKLAMRGGTGNWRPDSSGFMSFAYGYNAKAARDYSTAFGYNANAAGSEAVAIGKNSLASGVHSVALGYGSIASGDYATAMGYKSTGSGQRSMAAGALTRASGYAATAFGDSTISLGALSTAMGFRTLASGNISLATGFETEATGDTSIAMGKNTRASGKASTAIGNNTVASGDYSTAIGNYIRAGGEGSFAIGDNSVTTSVTFGTANRMTMRFAGGYSLYTNSGRTTGVLLSAGSNSWSTVSDIRKKEWYKPADGKAFLSKIASMKLGSWNYIGQDKNTFRHYGPMAQEFYKHFGNDGIGTIGNDTTIASADIDGVMMIAIQALVKENDILKSQHAELEARLQKLEAILTKEK